MSKQWRKILVIAILILISPAAQVIAAGHNNASNYYRTSSGASAEISEQKAIAIAKQHFAGRILAIQHDDHIYRIKMLSPQGTVHIILIHALDGKVLSAH